MNTPHAPRVYLSGLDLQGRRVLVVGAGRIATRRLPRLLESGAVVEVVAPLASAEITELAERGALVWHPREARGEDVEGAWYVLAASSSEQANAELARAAEARRIFCVRADKVHQGTAWTVSVARREQHLVGVLGNRDPRGTTALLQHILTLLGEEEKATAAMRGSAHPTTTGTLPAQHRPTRTDMPNSATLAPLEPGTVTLVGGGPGDPGLLTVAGLHALRQAEVVLVDHLAPTESLAECPEDCQIIPVGKLPRGEFVAQERINELLVSHARAGRRVVRLKGGDSFVFGRGGEEWQACAAAGVPVRVVPGVTSSVAAPELAGIPVTHRSLVQGFTVVSGHVPPGDERSTLDWAALAHTRTTLVVLMGVKYLARIAEALTAAGMDPQTPCAVVANAGHPDMQVVRGPLGGIAELAAGVQPPAVTVIGEVAGLDLGLPRQGAVEH